GASRRAPGGARRPTCAGAPSPPPSPGISRSPCWAKVTGPLRGTDFGLPSRPVNDRFGPIDFDEFHTVDLPDRLASASTGVLTKALAAAEPLAFRLDSGRAYTYTPTATGFDVMNGDADAATLVELEHRDWCDFVWELRSSFALLYADRVRFPRGTFAALARWEPALRAAFDGQPIYDLADAP